MTRTTRVVSLAIGLACVAGAAPAGAAPRTHTFTYGPIEVGPYQVKTEQLLFDVPKPDVDGYITAMDVDVVNADGTQVPISRLMLHHIVFANLGKPDGTCSQFTAWDSITKLPAAAERFYGAGEERARLQLPEGFGYPTRKADRWLMTYMFMNHRNKVDSAFIRYKVTVDTEPKQAVKPYWLDVENCKTDPVYDVPGGGGRGSTHVKQAGWTVPRSGQLVAGGGHVHGGARNLALRRRGCGDGGHLYTSKPLWGTRGHPFYNVRPVLHEPGPIDMSGFLSGQGFTVREGERLVLRSRYDNQLPHTRVMGIMVVFLAPGPVTREACPSRPADLREFRSTQAGRKKPPRFIVPITGIGRDGVARSIRAPKGKRRRVRSGYTVRVGSNYFRRPNLAVRRGSRVNWLFRGETLHNVTLASGPRGFSSANLDRGRRYRYRFRKPGTYKLFCALHPVDMTATVKVTRRKKRRT